MQKLDSTLKAKPATSSEESGMAKVKPVLKGDKMKKAASLNGGHPRVRNYRFCSFNASRPGLALRLRANQCFLTWPLWAKP